VVSFDVRIMHLENPAADFVDLFDPSIPPSLNPLFQGVNGPRVFDTWSSVKDEVYEYVNWDNTDVDPAPPAAAQAQRVPLPIRILAVKITIRVWDARTKQTQQISIIQDL